MFFSYLILKRLIKYNKFKYKTLYILTDCIKVFVNFSSTTSSEFILISFDQHWEYKKTIKNEVVLLRPKFPNKWLIVFWDEIN